MFSNHLTLALRSFHKNRSYALLNLLGLTISFAALLLILAYVQHETTYDRFHPQAERIFRPTYHYQSGDYDAHWARIPLDFINELPQEVPGIQHLIRFQNQQRKYVQIGEQAFHPPHTYTTDAEVFEVFEFELLSGDPTTALSLPRSVVLSQTLANTYFGTEAALGKTLQIRGDDQEAETYVVRGVMRDLPANTHLPVELLLSFSRPEDRTGWAYVYLLLVEGADSEQIAAAMPGFVDKHTDLKAGESIEFGLQALPDIHLHSDLAREIVPPGNARYPRLFVVIAAFLLLIAMFNFINLNSALVMDRAREIGMRRILGAERWQLVLAAISESVAYNLLAALLGLGLALGILPSLEQLLETPLAFSIGTAIGLLLLIALGCGLLAAWYPAYLLTSFQALAIFQQKNAFQSGGRGRQWSLRRIMLSLQLAVSILLLGSTFVAWHQIRFLQTRQMGKENSQVLAIPNLPQVVRDDLSNLLPQLKGLTGVQEAAACMEVPSREIRDAGPVLVQGGSQATNEAPIMDMQVVSPNFVSLMGLELLAGEDQLDRFLHEPPPELGEALSVPEYLLQAPRTYLINETAMKLLGWQRPEEAIGQQINWSIGGMQLAYGPITGVLRDYHQESLKNTIDPTILVYEPIWLGNLLIRVEAAQSRAVVANIEQLWQDRFPGYPLAYHFLDELYDQLYRTEHIQFTLLLICSGLAIFLALMGLFSLVAYALKTRVQEIALRKLMGADGLALLRLLSREYVGVWLIGAAIGIPLSVYGLQDWLDSFAYRIDLPYLGYLWSFLLLGGLMLLTIGIHTLRAHKQHPADALRGE
jgi:putative ABC transport system permease protein